LAALSRFFVLFILLPFFSVASQNNWLIKVSEHSPIAEQLAENTVYRFTNGDILLALDEVQLTELTPAMLSRQAGVYYIEPSQILQTKKSRFRLAAVEPAPQDFLLFDGFSVLPLALRNCENVEIAIIDSGVDIGHSQLSQNNFIFPFNAITNSTEQQDDFGHGTHVAGLIASQITADNAVQGACTQSSIIPIRFLDKYGGGSTIDAIRGISWAIEHNAQVINHSWTVNHHSQALFDAIKDANELGMVQVAAAGNIAGNNDNSAVYPAGYASRLAGFIAVANWDNEQQQLFQTSNYGLTGVDIAASGTNILSLAPQNSTMQRTGTSMAAPLVSAVAAMLKQQNSNLTSSQVRSILQQSSHQEGHLSSSIRSGGRLDAEAALNFNLINPSILVATLEADSLVLYGDGFVTEDQWQYSSTKTNSKAVVLTPLLLTKNKASFAASELSNGYFQLLRAGKVVTQLAYQPELAAPSQIQTVKTDAGLLVTWNGSVAADYYQLQAAVDDAGFTTIAELLAPLNQFEHRVADYKSVRYRLKASYNYQFTGAEPRVEYSEFSEIYNVEAKNLFWQTDIVASAPLRAEAEIHLQTAAADNAYFELQEATEGFVLGLNSNGLLYLDTQQERQGQATIAYRIDGTESIKTVALSVHGGLGWQLNLSDKEQIVLRASAYKITSFQRLVDGKFLVHGIAETETPILSFSLHSNSRNFSLISALVSDEALSDEQLLQSEQLITVHVPADNVQVPGPISVLLDVKLVNPVGSTTDSRCFIASSIYPHQPGKLQKFRLFRDNVLLKLPGGKALVNRYYRYSPLLVEQFKKAPKIKMLIKQVLERF